MFARQTSTTCALLWPLGPALSQKQSVARLLAHFTPSVLLGGDCIFLFSTDALCIEKYFSHEFTYLSVANTLLTIVFFYTCLIPQPVRKGP
jgi:hypothetical protein